MSIADKVTEIIASVEPEVAVVFIGREPRLIATLDAMPSAAVEVRHRVDAALISRGLSAAYLSLAECNGKRFIAAHG